MAAPLAAGAAHPTRTEVPATDWVGLAGAAGAVFTVKVGNAAEALFPLAFVQ